MCRICERLTSAINELYEIGQLIRMQNLSDTEVGTKFALASILATCAVKMYATCVEPIHLALEMDDGEGPVNISATKLVDQANKVVGDITSHVNNLQKLLPPPVAQA